MTIHYKKNYYLDQLKPYVENAILRHIQLQKDYTSTFYFQQLNYSGKINNKDELNHFYHLSIYQSHYPFASLSNGPTVCNPTKPPCAAPSFLALFPL